MKTALTIAAIVLVLLLFVVLGAFFVAALYMKCEDCPHRKECEDNKDFVCPYHDTDFHNPNLSF